MKKYTDFRKSPAKQLDNFINTIDFKDIHNMIQKLETPPNLILKTKHSAKEKLTSEKIICKAQIAERYENINKCDVTTNVDSEAPSEITNKSERQIENFGRNLHRRHNTENVLLTNNSEYFDYIDDEGNVGMEKEQESIVFEEKEEEQWKCNEKSKLIERLYLLEQKISEAKLSETEMKVLSSKIENMEKLLENK